MNTEIESPTSVTLSRGFNVAIRSPAEEQIRSLWTALSVAEKQHQKRGLQFGQAMYEYREKHSAQGRRTDLVSPETKSETFEEFCDRLEITRATAYRWIARYEETIGERQPKPIPPTPESKDAVEIEQVAPVTPQEQRRRDIAYLAKRLSSIKTALQQMRSNPRWSEEDISEVIKLAEEIGNEAKQLRDATRTDPEDAPPPVRLQTLPRLEQAKLWLVEYLKDGPRPIPDSYVQHGLCRYNYNTGDLPPEGIGPKTIDRAIEILGVQKLRTGPRGGIRWHLPETQQQEAIGAA